MKRGVMSKNLYIIGFILVKDCLVLPIKTCYCFDVLYFTFLSKYILTRLKGKS